MVSPNCDGVVARLAPLLPVVMPGTWKRFLESSAEAMRERRRLPGAAYDFQWQRLEEDVSAPPRHVRDKQRAIIEKAMEACPGNPRLLRAASCAEGDECAGLDAATVLASRRARLLACGHAEAAEELVLGSLGVGIGMLGLGCGGLAGLAALAGLGWTGCSCCAR